MGVVDLINYMMETHINNLQVNVNYVEVLVKKKVFIVLENVLEQVTIEIVN